LLPGVVGHGVLNWALKYVKAPIVAVSILGESVGASILAYIIFGELLLWYQIIGGILILVGIYIAASNEVTGDGSSVT
ncbi:MAG: EamA family transporter, partial [Syntrophomonadaceae bacterium]|nr:EamA family transporter [Syntrophomonadaceae bacterium]